MTASSESIVLKKCRVLMKNLGQCNETKFHAFGSKKRIVVPVWLIRLLYSMPMLTCVILAVLHIAEKNLDLTESSVAFIVIVGGGHCHVIYLLMAFNNNSLVNVIEQLQKLIDTRKFRGEKSIFCWKLWKCFFVLLTLLI